MLGLQGHDFLPHLTLGDRLQVPVERGDDGQSAVLDQLPTVGLLQLRGDPVDEARRLDVVRRRGLLRTQLLRVGGIRLGRRDRVVAHHRVQHYALPCLGPIEVGDGIEFGRRLWQAGEEAGLSQRQLAGGLAEVGQRRRLHPIRPIAVIDPIQIRLEDLGLRVLMLDLDREDRLVQLAQHGAVFREVDVLDELLGDRAAALVEAKVEQVVEAGLARAQQVQTAVLVKAAVLDGDGRLLHRRRDLLQRHDVAPL